MRDEEKAFNQLCAKRDELNVVRFLRHIDFGMDILTDNMLGMFKQEIGVSMGMKEAVAVAKSFTTKLYLKVRENVNRTIQD